MQQNKKGGPVTPEGKDASSQNSTSHGLRQERFKLLPHESPAEFEAMAANYRAEHAELAAAHPAMHELINHVIERDWMMLRSLRRVDRLEAAREECVDFRKPEAVEAIDKALANAYRYKTSNENSFARALRNLEQFRKARLKEFTDYRRLQLHAFLTIEKVMEMQFKQNLADITVTTPDLFKLFRDYNMTRATTRGGNTDCKTDASSSTANEEALHKQD